MIVPGYAVGRVIGKGGKTIQNIQVSNKCTLVFLTEEADENGDTPLEIMSKTNNDEDIAAAFPNVEDIVSNKLQFRNFCMLPFQIRNGIFTRSCIFRFIEKVSASSTPGNKKSMTQETMIREDNLELQNKVREKIMARKTIMRDENESGFVA